jgi:hypothetical protein
VSGAQTQAARAEEDGVLTLYPAQRETLPQGFPQSAREPLSLFPLDLLQKYQMRAAIAHHAPYELPPVHL